MSEHTEAAIETTNALTAAAAKTTVLGGGTAVTAKFFGLDPITFIGLCIGVGGLIVSILSFIINWYYKRKEDIRAQEIHEIVRAQEIHELEKLKSLGNSHAKQD